MESVLVVLCRLQVRKCPQFEIKKHLHDKARREDPDDRKLTVYTDMDKYQLE